MLYLNEEFERSWQGADPFKMLQAMEGNIYRQVHNRKTFQFNLNGKSYFVKMHTGVGWSEIVKNLSQLRLPILGAENEWRAITRLQELGIATMKFVAYGKRGWNPATIQSFIVTEDLTDTISLEDYCKDWSKNKPAFSEKKALIQRIAGISRKLHNNGMCHRDFYLCHFLLHRNIDASGDKLKLSLIDLHRVIIKQNLATRWKVKDIAGLYYSSMHIGLTQRDLFRFIRNYDQVDLRHSLRARQGFWSAVYKRAQRMYRKLGPAN